MSKKTLLSESQIRQFMKLAKLEPLTPGFVEGLTESADELEERSKTKPKPGAMYEEEEAVEEGMGMYRDEDEMDEVRTGLGPDYDLTGDLREVTGRGTGPADGLEEQEEAEEWLLTKMPRTQPVMRWRWMPS